MSTHVHRDGARQITVQDQAGRELVLISQDHTLRVTTNGAEPCLTPQMALDLAEELHQWANAQQTVRNHAQPGPDGSATSSFGEERTSAE